MYDRYRDVHEVDQDFRTMQTGLLEVRPICVRQAPRTRAHVLVTMFALKVVREMAVPWWPHSAPRMTTSWQ